MKAKLTLLKLSLIVLFILSGCGNMFTKNKTKFHWLAQESAPQNFYMRVINGTFYYHNKDGGLYIPTAAKIGYNWGEGESVHVVGDDFKTLPDRVDIRFYSFWENKIYHGSFELPYEKILALFKEGVAKDKENPTFRKIIVGMAPGGAVAVWVSGRETREVFFGYAKPYEDNMYDPLGGPIEDTKEYAESYLQDLSPDIYAHIKKEGVPFGIWEKYRKTYPWSFAAAFNKQISVFGVSFYNGESYPIETPLNENYTPKPIPLSMSFITVFPDDKTKYVYSIGFDYTETNEVMEKLSADGKQVTVLINSALPKNSSTVSLSNGKETIELKKIIHK